MSTKTNRQDLTELQQHHQITQTRTANNIKEQETKGDIEHMEWKKTFFVQKRKAKRKKRKKKKKCAMLKE